MRKAIVVALLFASVPLFAARADRHTLNSRGKERHYVLFVPEGVDREHPAALLITLHGSGRDGASLVDKWKGLAKEEHVIVAGPDSIDSSRWSSPDDGPQLLFDLVEEIKGHYAIDPRRIYLFGHSAGAEFALQMGCLESEYFAAVALHAGALQPSMYPIATYATRKIPFAIFIGTRDAFFSLDAVRATRDELQKAGMAVELTEIRNHTHDYYGRADSINKSAWEFLARHALAAEPNFTVYSNMQ